MSAVQPPVEQENAMVGTEPGLLPLRGVRLEVRRDPPSYARIGGALAVRRRAFTGIRQLGARRL